MEPMTVTNSNHDNGIDNCVAIIANDGNNENLVQKHCPFVNIRIESDKILGNKDFDGFGNYNVRT